MSKIRFITSFCATLLIFMSLSHAHVDHIVSTDNKRYASNNECDSKRNSILVYLKNKYGGRRDSGTSVLYNTRTNHTIIGICVRKELIFYVNGADSSQNYNEAVKIKNEIWGRM